MDAQLRLIPRSDARKARAGRPPTAGSARGAGNAAAGRRADGSGEHAVPEHGRSEHRIPEHRVPEHRVPEHRVPEHRAPEPAEAPAAWRIDDTARERGRRGISQAREALRRARRPLPGDGHPTAA
jgi:hypothetical protein